MSLVNLTSFDKSLDKTRRSSVPARYSHHPTTVLSPSLFNATIPQYSDMPMDPPPQDDIMLTSESMSYENYTEYFVPMENGRPLFEDSSCEPIKEWQTTHYPNCLTFHSLDYTDLTLLGVGNARIVWKLGDERVALKTTRKHHFKTVPTLYESWRIDAMISERLSASPHVLDLYGHCGMATLNQVGTVVPHWYRKPGKSSRKILSLALQLSRAVADIHSIDGDDETPVTAVWRNIKPDNVLFVGNRLTITDFDESLLPWWSPKDKKMCKFHITGQKAKRFQPLELTTPHQTSDEKIDIYSLGTMLHTILTGTPPFTRYNHVQLKQRGVAPAIPKKIRKKKDSMSKALHKVSLQCMAKNPNNRPSAREVVKALEKALSRKK
jgi:serine/threonine protein kinase